MLKKVKRKLNQLSCLLESHTKSSHLTLSKQDDIISLGLLQPLIANFSYVAFSGWAVRPFCLALILNDIVANQRKSIVEFGAGITTIFMARLMKQNGLSAKVISVEHNLEWINIIKDVLKKDATEQYVEFIHAELSVCEKSPYNLSWYNEEAIFNQIKNKRFDLVIIDGPPVYNEYERYPALPFIFDYLGPNYSVYLDDVDRTGEKQILAKWEELKGMKFNVLGEKIARSIKGTFYDTVPVWSY
jgi:predicted O-methyltransferase YrrM